MTTHLGLMALFAVYVSIVFAALTRDDVREQARFAARLFAAFVVAGIIAGWVLYPLPF
jgi:hypothetical protein